MGLKKRHDFTFDVSGLPAYVDQTSDELLLESHFGFPSAALVSKQTGIKLTAALQLFDATATRTADDCAFSSTSTETFTQVNLTVGAIKYDGRICLKDLIPKWTQRLLLQGSNAETTKVTFEEDIVKEILDVIKEENEQTLWQGDTGGAGIFVFFEGLIVNIDAGSPIDGNAASVTVATGITNANAVAIINGMVDSMTTNLKLKDDLVLVCGTDTYDKWTTNMFNLNLFHHVADTKAYSSTIPAKNIPIEGVPGLDTLDRIFLYRKSNLFMGVDLESDEDEFRMWNTIDMLNIDYTVRFKMGTAVARPAEVVEFTLVP